MTTPAGSSNTSLYQLLQLYAESPAEQPWVAATVVTKEGSGYRKPGAMMLVSALGKCHGLVSGGCLELDIVLRARRVLEYRQPEYAIYDSTEDGNIAAELGLGCNGRIGVLIQELGPGHRDLLLGLLARMKQGLTTRRVQCIVSPEVKDLEAIALVDDQHNLLAGSLAGLEAGALGDGGGRSAWRLDLGAKSWAVTTAKPPPRLWVIGGGVDAQPVVRIAAMLGWRVTVADHRTAYGRRHDFPAAEALVRSQAADLGPPLDADGVILMSHNLAMDAAWLRLVRDRGSRTKYIGLLGPGDRKAEVLALAGIPADSDFAASVHGPMGLDIGGDLPESIAVSVIAQCHQQLARQGLV